jgi:hypothetical protein
MRLIKALMDRGHTVLSYMAIDTAERYARESRLAIAEEFNKEYPDRPNIQTQAIVGDFMSNSKIHIPPPLPGAVTLISIFGAPCPTLPITA